MNAIVSNQIIKLLQKVKITQKLIFNALAKMKG
jgi:hypothetical protein